MDEDEYFLSRLDREVQGSVKCLVAATEMGDSSWRDDETLVSVSRTTVWSSEIQGRLYKDEEGVVGW